MVTSFPIIAAVAFLAVLLVVSLVLSILFRTVVPTNMVHIVQSRKKTVSYGTSQDNGNVYYLWPSWVPFIGVAVMKLQVSNFALNLQNYLAYDIDRVPFEVDVTAFFRVSNSQLAAERVSDFAELMRHLNDVVEGSVRKILSSSTIDTIMTERATFGEQFTLELSDDLKNWGLETVKSMELMDIRDAAGSNAVANIKAKKLSFIEMESRTTVAENKKKAEMAEITAQNELDIKRQEAEQSVGERTAQKNKAVGIAEEVSQQEIKAQQAMTEQKAIEVKRVKEIGDAEITKQREIVKAEEMKQTTILKAQGDLESTKLSAEGVRTEGQAKADAEKAMQMAPVEAQIALGKEIGENEGYQSYLISLKTIEAFIEVGKEQAGALKSAEVKIIANTGNASSGIASAMDFMSPKGGMAIAGMLEALAQAPEGKALLNALGSKLASAGDAPKAIEGTTATSAT